MDSLQPTWRTRLHVYSHWHRATPLDLMVRVPAKIGGECLLWVIADISVAKNDVRFSPESGHVRCNSSCLLWAKSGHQQRSKGRYSITSSAIEGTPGGTSMPSACAV